MSEAADWDKKVVIRKRGEQIKVTKGSSAINAARRAGVVVETERKTTGGTNKGHVNADHQRIAKIDRENEIAPPPKISLSVGKAIQQARQAKGLNQKDLGQKINEKANIMGRTIPNQQVLSKLERVLGIRLRGKNIGETLTK
ncbi:6553_t:CDS:2 [Ambispora gerdemannii]|uniref:6553_t:CDS:1 n=1 Tax=Ambispora gerdemannii TaxID=144530 RepID=A0A9N8VI72_9GLOM|nr:6553_t:CDS:2 [Ambispora gerdemannii]